MRKQEFLAQLRARLSGIPQDDMEERISFYSEMIDDRIEEGWSEEQAVADLGTLESIARQIMSEIPLAKLVKEKVKPGRALRAWEITLLVMGSPIWLSLLALILAMYAVVWSLVVSLWAVELSVVACSVASILAAAAFFTRGAIIPGIAMLGAGALCAGLAIGGWYGCRCATGGIWKLTKRTLIRIKSCFRKKEAAK